MSTSQPITKVIFRVDTRKEWRGTVTAIFPETLDYRGWFDCYESIGQHGRGHVSYMQATRPATEQEYASLKKELESIGYNLRVMKRMKH